MCINEWFYDLLEKMYVKSGNSLNAVNCVSKSPSCNNYKKYLRMTVEFAGCLASRKPFLVLESYSTDGFSFYWLGICK